MWNEKYYPAGRTNSVAQLTFLGVGTGPALPLPAPVAAVDVVRWRLVGSLAELTNSNKTGKGLIKLDPTWKNDIEMRDKEATAAREPLR